MCPSLAVLPTLGTKTILILGASYGGARVARVISEFLGKEGGFRNWRVVVVDRNRWVGRLSEQEKRKGYSCELTEHLCHIFTRPAMPIVSHQCASFFLALQHKVLIQTSSSCSLRRLCVSSIHPPPTTRYQVIYTIQKPPTPANHQRRISLNQPLYSWTHPFSFQQKRKDTNHLNR